MKSRAKMGRQKNQYQDTVIAISETESNNFSVANQHRYTEKIMHD